MAETSIVVKAFVHTGDPIVVDIPDGKTGPVRVTSCLQLELVLGGGNTIGSITDRARSAAEYLCRQNGLTLNSIEVPLGERSPKPEWLIQVRQPANAAGRR